MLASPPPLPLSLFHSLARLFSRSISPPHSHTHTLSALSPICLTLPPSAHAFMAGRQREGEGEECMHTQGPGDKKREGEDLACIHRAGKPKERSRENGWVGRWVLARACNRGFGEEREPCRLSLLSLSLSLSLPLPTLSLILPPSL